MLIKSSWRYYNHAVIPTTAPHEEADVQAHKRKDFWTSFKGEGYPLLARWTSDYDCQVPTDWWYVVKDKPFDFMDVCSNYRQKIRRGLKNFEIKVIDPVDYAEALYQVEAEALSSYPAKYRPKLNHDQFIAAIFDPHKNKCTTFAAFSKETHDIAGYMCVLTHDSFISLYAQKAKPREERKHLNAALVYGFLDYYSEELARGIYIVDGERSILHETLFQDYLEKYFAFRKAYCRLHILYRRGVAQLVAILYPMRGLVRLFSGTKLFCHVNSVLKMEEIIRKQDSSHPMGEHPKHPV